MTGARRSRRRWLAAAGIAAAGVAAALWLSRPRPLPATVLPAHAADPRRGEVLYRVGSCHACHRAAPGEVGEATGAPVGTAPFPTPFGTFYPGNLTPAPETGLGRWRAIDFVNAMARGLAPDGRHYFPAFPYTSYRAMPVEDLLDLWAYLGTLEPIEVGRRRAQVPLLPLARRGVGLWKRLALGPVALERDPARGEAWNRGAYLALAPGHCGECHTPRDALMRLDPTRSLAGGAHPAGEGRVPSLRGLAARGRYRDAADLALALRYGEELGFDKLSSGGMAKIQVELSHLPDAELEALAEYLMSLEPL